MIEVTRGRGDDPEARELIAAMEAWITEHFGPPTAEHQTSIVAAAEMVPPTGAFVVVLDDGRPVAGGGIRRLEEGVAEVKRMYVAGEARGRGHGRRVLEELERAAVDLGYRALRLDTAQSMTAAKSLYLSAGFVEIPDYNANRYASFWAEKKLA
jgi:ribosomal protein S18 acetylase RimI-like enzyme